MFIKCTRVSLAHLLPEQVSIQVINDKIENVLQNVQEVWQSGVCWAERTFSIDYEHDTFLKDGQPFSYVSGSVHYTRIPPYYWRDRLLKMRAAGLNAIQTYVPWNAHEPQQGEYDFEGANDLVGFLQTAHDLGLLAIVRAGPYMCGEWEFGGFPAWILKNNASVVLRSMDPGYIKPVDKWLDVLLPKLKPLLYENGGPIILTQVENEYGSFFTCSQAYMAHLRDTFRALLGPRAVLITTDGAGTGYLKCGAVQGVYATVDFGPGNATNGFAPMRQWNPHGPLVNSEFYTGWLDHWGSAHAHGNTVAIVRTLTDMLHMNASVNMYMFEGGTNFRYMNGVNAPFSPVPTSYDYDAPLSEAGDPTSKYMAIRALLMQAGRVPKIPVPPPTPKAAYGPVTMKFVLSMVDAAEQLSDGPPISTTYPLSMEQVGQNYGFIFYSHVLKSNFYGQELEVAGLRDRAHVLVDGSQVALLDRTQTTSFNLVAAAGQRLQLLVENMGRVNYGKQMLQQNKGITSNVTVGGENLTDWTIHRLNLTRFFDHQHLISEQLNARSSGSVPHSPALYSGSFVISNDSAPRDTFLSMPGWFKGQLLVNGQNLGRYWPARGPQLTLYVPRGALLPHPHANTLLLLELDHAPCTPPTPHRLTAAANTCQVVFEDTPILNGTTARRHPTEYTHAALLGRWRA